MNVLDEPERFFWRSVGSCSDCPQSGDRIESRGLLNFVN